MSSHEDQNIEWKESWRDEYLKWICGFANSHGGKLYIGKNDKGVVVGIPDALKLMNDLPNKVRDMLGIMVKINLLIDAGNDYLEIITESHPYPVSYKGNYYIRSGSTNQELKGGTLDKFILQKQGIRWDGVPVPDVKVSDLKKETFDLFRKKAIKSGRASEDILQETITNLLDNLRLKEKNYLKRAAILLFHPEPEKYVSGAFVKIGFFRTTDDLAYQDEVYGNIFEQIENTLSLLKTKYLKAFISYEGITRVERIPFPELALREALINALAHKDYSGTAPVQIRVYDNRIIIWNQGQLPEDWTIEKLKQEHPSQPYNPDIARALFRSGYIEAWGRGTIKIINECLAYGLPSPIFRYDFSGFFVEFYTYNEAVLKEKGLKDSQIKIILYTVEQESITNLEVQKLLNVSRQTASRYLSELEGTYLLKIGTTGKNTFYKLKDS